jgi:RND family efflux transporter MFP subunit
MSTLPKKAAAVVGVLVVIAVITVALSRPRARAANNEIEQIPVAAVSAASRGAIANTYSIAGEFIPYQEVELHAKVAGYIRRINVDIGDHVRAGQVLATLEVPELNAQVQGATAGVRRSSEEIVRAQHEVRRAEASHEALHAAAVRLQQASKARPGLIAQQELDDAQAKDMASEAQVEAAKSGLSASQQQLDIAKAGATQYTAMQDYSKIIAPFDGVVTWRYADTGSLIQAGTSNSSSMPVVKIAQSNLLRLRIPVPESLAARVREGDTADVRVQATGEHFTGKVARYTNSLDRSTRSMQVEIDVPNSKYKLAPGMYADVVLHTQENPTALTIPVQALERNGNKTSVMIVDASDRVQPREISTGIESADKVEVVSGLQEGDRVIVGNPNSYTAGEHVKPKVSRMANVSLADNGGGQ